MTETVENHADPANAVVSSDSDPLTDVLLQARLRGEDARLHAASATDFLPGPTRVHFAMQTPLQVAVDGHRAAVPLEGGDCILIRHGLAHTITTAETADPAGQVWVTGTYQLDEREGAPMLTTLPRVVHLRAAVPGNEWLRLSLQLLLMEIRQRGPGSWLMISRILDLVYVHALRQWAGSADMQPGWLATALEADFAPVLAAVHRDPGRAWTVDDLAVLARRSRSSFAHGFTERIGQSPMAYVAEARMRAASRMLEGSSMRIGDIARTVGFTSDAAFSRAFRRYSGSAPLAWRRAHHP